VAMSSIIMSIVAAVQSVCNCDIAKIRAD